MMPPEELLLLKRWNKNIFSFLNTSKKYNSTESHWTKNTEFRFDSVVHCIIACTIFPFCSHLTLKLQIKWITVPNSIPFLIQFKIIVVRQRCGLDNMYSIWVYKIRFFILVFSDFRSSNLALCVFCLYFIQLLKSVVL